MAGLCRRMSDWVTSPFSAVVYFQKHFIDDVADTVKRQKEQFDRHTREAQERAIQLHLDELEGKYLCCVCGRPGEAREDDSLVYDTFSMVEMPTLHDIERGINLEQAAAQQQQVAEEFGHANATTRGKKGRVKKGKKRRGASLPSSSSSSVRRSRSVGSQQHPRRHEVPSSSHGVSARSSSAGVAAHREEESTTGADDADCVVDVDDSDGGSISRRHSDAPSSVDLYGDVDPRPSAGGRGRSASAAVAPRADIAALNPDLVPPLEIRSMMYKIRHAVLNKEARVKRSAVHVHRDKGLTRIEESEVDMYSSFFQRPVHGFLCRACHVSAKRRLDTVTEQIQTILFQGKYPLLRKVSQKEMNVLASAGQLSPRLVMSILAMQRRWREEQRLALAKTGRRGSAAGADVGGASTAGGETILSSGHPHSTAAAAAEVGVAEGGGGEEQEGGEEEEADHLLRAFGGGAAGAAKGSAQSSAAMATLSDDTVLTLRATVRCEACRRRAACFFTRVSVLFLCQFCVARDRFYRDNAVCINDSPLPVETVHLLNRLAAYHEGVHRAQELRQLPQTELEVAPTDLFGRHESLFKVQAIPGKKLEAVGGGGGAQHPVPSSSSSGEVLKVEARPYMTAEVVERHNGEENAREAVGRTQLSLFEDIRVEPVAARSLFDNPATGPVVSLFGPNNNNNSSNSMNGNSMNHTTTTAAANGLDSLFAPSQPPTGAATATSTNTSATPPRSGAALYADPFTGVSANTLQQQQQHVHSGGGEFAPTLAPPNAVSGSSNSVGAMTATAAAAAAGGGGGRRALNSNNNSGSGSNGAGGGGGEEADDGYGPTMWL